MENHIQFLVIYATRSTTRHTKMVHLQPLLPIINILSREFHAEYLIRRAVLNTLHFGHCSVVRRIENKTRKCTLKGNIYCFV